MKKEAAPLELKRLLSKKGPGSVVRAVLEGLPEPAGIFDAGGKLLMGKDLSDRTPVEVAEEVIGWVAGKSAAPALAPLIHHLAGLELEKKTLARETLNKYREINMLYNISENLADCLDLEAVAGLILEVATDFIASDSASVMLLDEDSGLLRIVSALGTEFTPKTPLAQGQGIAGSVLSSGKAEIVNRVGSDPRYVKGANRASSLLCAPLRMKDSCRGVLTLSSAEPMDYSAEDLKLLSALAGQAASAIENALLHAHKLREERIKSNLERYLSPQLVSAVIDANSGVSLSPAKKNITILFSDIRNFSRSCEILSAEEVVGLLNRYFTAMVDVIFSRGGTVNKFVGDMIVALFGAPSGLAHNERQAIEAAICMQERIRSLPVQGETDIFQTGIGINAGEVVVGNMGSPRHMDYTAIGDEVNVAARLQTLAGPGQIMVSRNVYEAAREAFTFREIGKVELKGKTRVVEVFEVLY